MPLCVISATCIYVDHRLDKDGVVKEHEKHMNKLCYGYFMHCILI